MLCVLHHNFYVKKKQKTKNIVKAWATVDMSKQYIHGASVAGATGKLGLRAFSPHRSVEHHAL